MSAREGCFNCEYSRGLDDKFGFIMDGPDPIFNKVAINVPHKYFSIDVKFCALHNLEEQIAIYRCDDWLFKPIDPRRIIAEFDVP